MPHYNTHRHTHTCCLCLPSAARAGSLSTWISVVLKHNTDKCWQFYTSFQAAAFKWKSIETASSRAARDMISSSCRLTKHWLCMPLCLQCTYLHVYMPKCDWFATLHKSLTKGCEERTKREGNRSKRFFHYQDLCSSSCFSLNIQIYSLNLKPTWLCKHRTMTLCSHKHKKTTIYNLNLKSSCISNPWPIGNIVKQLIALEAISPRCFWCQVSICKKVNKTPLLTATLSSPYAPSCRASDCGLAVDVRWSEIL